MTIAVFILIAAILFLDQLSKFLILKYIGFNTTLVVLKGIFSITPIRNSGGGFGILPNQTFLFISISLLTIVFLILVLGDTLQHKKGAWKLSLFVQQSVPFWKVKEKLVLCTTAMILAGALGNLVDRLRLGAVIDFVDFKLWPVFNIADSCISIGITILIWQLLKKNL